MAQKVIVLICVSFITAHAQSTTIDINAANPQRTRVLNTKGLEAAPSQVLWKSEKLFIYHASEWMPGIAGPLSMSINVPTFQNFTVPIIAGDLLYFSFRATDSYLFAIDKATGQKVMVLKVDNNRISRPAARDNIVFFGSSRGEVHAYDVTKRDDKWTFLDKDHSFAGSYPTLDRDLLYVYADKRGLYAFDVETGAVKWLFKQRRAFSTFVKTWSSSSKIRRALKAQRRNRSARRSFVREWDCWKSFAMQVLLMTRFAN